MTAFLFIAAIAALALSGLIVLAIPYVRSLDAPACVAIALPAGMTLCGVLMFATSVMNIRWSRTLFIAMLLPFAIAGIALWLRRRKSDERLRIVEWIPFAVVIAITTYAAVDARSTCGDYLFFWGPKAAHFWFAHRIDASFLADPTNFFMHADYPPLLPLLYAFGATMIGKFSWWGGLLVMPLSFAAMTIAFRGIAARAIGQRSASLFALLLLALIAFCSQVDPVGGAGEPLLLLFETIALAALTFAPDDRGAATLASIMLAGAVLTKVEGTMFTAVLVVMFALAQRRIGRAMSIAIAPAIAFVAWYLFARHYRLLDAYTLHGRSHYENIFRVMKILALDVAPYSAWYLPIIAVVAPMAFARNWRRAALPLLVTAGSIAWMIYAYLQDADPTFHIASSAHRVLLTPLMSLAVATAATSE